MLSRSQRVAWQHMKQQATNGIAVRISRGGRLSVPITGVLTIREYEVIDEADGMPTSIKSADWLFKAADLVLRGEVITLRARDELVATINEVEHTFQVIPIAQKPAQEAVDGHGVTVVVHTKDLSWEQC
jgi:hypothetical protein